MVIDICVYGGTSGAVVAAVRAARAGHSVLLVEPGRHLGGMTSGGLGCTDIGKDNAVGGIALEFYRRLGQAYGQDTEAWFFEPHLAESVYQAMVRESGVRVLFEHRLLGAQCSNHRIEEVALEHAPTDSINAQSPAPASGERLTVKAAIFIDATYEGDLMAAAKVSYTVGRESNQQYGETLNGIRADAGNQRFRVPVDPFIRPGDPGSGLLPFICHGELGNPGDADRRVQAYNYRLCLTQVPANRLPIEPPANYDPNRYELLARSIEAMLRAGLGPRHLYKDRLLLKVDAMPNGKTDVNNTGSFSTDYIGASWSYPDADHVTRGRIWHDHLDYTAGLLHFLATSPRVPSVVREEMQTWGLCRDEFQDTGGWPHQLYVREARRMVSDYVATQADCETGRVAPDSIGLGTYPMDAHTARRNVVDGSAHNEGNMGVLTKSAWQISYRSIAPRAAECQNLLVPVCVSASHVAYGSLRMEPTFMVLGQSAAVAASLAIQAGCAVQQVPYPRLSAILEKDEQILIWPGGGDGIPNPSAGQSLDAK